MAVKKRAIIHLVRHAQSTANSQGILAGRDNSVGLTPRGQEQSRALANHLNSLPLSAIYTSPISRCLATLKPFLATSRLAVQKVSGVAEMDYGNWSGKKLKILALKPAWKVIQRRPSAFRFPDGESFLEMNARAVSAVYELAKPGREIAICTHGDVIKALLAHFSGEHMDTFQKWSIDPASTTTIAIAERSVKILKVNNTKYLGEVTAKPARSVLGGGAGSTLKPKRSTR
jgi:probable phosphomutase (TIGR03848 family)